MQISDKLSNAVGIPNLYDPRYVFLHKKLYKNSNEDTKEQPCDFSKKIYSWRLMIFVKSIYDLSERKSVQNNLSLMVTLGPYINVYDLNPILNSNSSNLDVRLSSFYSDYKGRPIGNTSYTSTRAPTPISSSLARLSNQREIVLSSDNLKINRIRVYYACSANPDITDYLKSESVKFQVFETNNGKNKLIAHGSCFAFKDFDVFNKDTQIQHSDVYLFNGPNALYSLKIVSGINLEETNKYIPDKVLPYNGILYPTQSYHTPEPLPADWIRIVFEENKKQVSPNNSMMQNSMLSLRRSEQRIQSAIGRRKERPKLWESKKSRLKSSEKDNKNKTHTEKIKDVRRIYSPSPVKKKKFEWSPILLNRKKNSNA